MVRLNNEADNIYVSEDGKKTFTEKPEHMTCLRGNILVEKNHKRIKLRGKIDSFIAELLLLMNEIMREKNTTMLDDLKTLLDYMKKLQLSEVSEKFVEKIDLLGLSQEQLREISHHPKKYYSSGHLFGLSFEEDVFVLKLNKLRTCARALEIAALETFNSDDDIRIREDFSTGLNRLSSAIYIMEIKAISGEYNKVK